MLSYLKILNNFPGNFVLTKLHGFSSGFNKEPSKTCNN